ncbi:MAG: protein translocase subunit SecD, partial [Caulobacteraceae bacterium]
MLQLSRWKLVLVLLATVFGLLFTLPNVLPASTLASLPSWFPKQKLNLGLDLQGGSYLLYEVDTAAMKRERVTNLLEDVRTNLRDKQIAFSGLSMVGDHIELTIVDPAQTEAAYQQLQKALPRLPDGTAEFNVARSGERLTLTMSDAALTQESVTAVKQSIEVIRRRIDALGTREPSITQQGSNRIVVQAPGESDPEKLKRVVGQTAKLTFQMHDDSVSVEDAKAGRLPPGSAVYPSDDGFEKEIVLKRRVLVSGEMLTDSRFAFNPQTSKPVVTFRFNGQGARRFAVATQQNVGKRFAIVLDNRVISAPNINEPITGGSGEISGNFTTESANNLAILLRAGALPAPLTIQEQQTVSAELGADAIRAGA